MITEFTCGIYTAVFNECGGPHWHIKIVDCVIAIVDADGATIIWCSACPPLTKESLIEVAVLMNNIKRQYIQLNAV